MSHFTMNLSGNIPNLVVPKSRYSSTETDLMSSDYEESNNVGDHNGKHPISGFSTSAASSSGSSRKRTRKRRRRIVNGTVSVSALSVSNKSVSGKSLSSSRQTITEQTKSEGSDNDEVKSWKMCERKGKCLPTLNSVNDLKHATGRHRGISGSRAPAIDAALFALFYTTDIFDELFIDTPPAPQLLHPQYAQNNRNRQLRRDLILLLKREIVYSLRISYFCPASKVVKLLQLVEKYYPDHVQVIQDAASFFDLLFGKLLKLQPFLTYVNGSTSYIHSINLEKHLTMKYGYQPTALTIQKLLHQKSIFCVTNSQRGHHEESQDFATVPYPALIIKVIRKPPSDKSVDSESMYYWDKSSETHHNQYKRPIIPNLQIDISNLISRNSSDNGYFHHKSHGSNWKADTSISNSQFSVISYKNSQEGLHEPENDVDEGAKSGFVKGFKSVWKLMYKYLEDLTLFPSHINVPESSFLSVDAGYSNPEDRTNVLRVKVPVDVDKESSYKSLGDNSYLNSSTLSLSSVPSSSLFPGGKIANLEEYFTASVSKQSRVKLELIAVICKSKRSSVNDNGHSRTGYSVYCKAGKDVTLTAEKSQDYAPWMLYEPRSGNAPEVVLIENFGKWMDSLERHHESCNLQEIPLEIRRVLEDSNVFIYSRLEK